MSLADHTATMLNEREAIRAHAQERLERAGADGEHVRRVDLFKRFLKLETDRLRMRHRMGLGGLDVAATRSYQIDQLVTRAAQVAAESAGPAAAAELSRSALVALGGYGRGELAPFSDVDLLFLHRGRPTAVLTQFVEQVLMLLWDTGLTVGHSFRSPKECVAICRDDLVSRTSLTEARLVAGSAELFQELLAAMDGLLRDRRARDAFLEVMRREYGERHAKHEGAVCVQEPDVKEGVGGLRELHTVLWIAHARLGARGLAGLEAGGFITEREHKAARRAYDFLARVRNEAHFSTGRKTDRLSLDLQDEIARRLGYAPHGGLLSSELFMRDYYRRGTELAEFADRFVRRDLEPAGRGLLSALRSKRTARGLEVRAGRLHSRRAELPGGGAALLEVFAVAQAEGVPLSDDLADQVRGRLGSVDSAFRQDAHAARTFVDVLRWRGRVAPALRAMHETGFLGRYLPEFGRISFLVQHDFFHRYTVDEHTLRAIEALDEVAAGASAEVRPFGRVLDEVEDAAPLYLGMLLHDIGKGRGGGHVQKGARMAPRVCERLGLDRERAAEVVFLVDAHLEMSQVSQQRDLTEAAPIAAFAERVGSLDRLNMLLLLTYADHRAVAPGIWNEWKGALLWELYNRTRERLAGLPGPAATAGHEAMAKAITALRATVSEAEIERHFGLMPERYLRSTDAARMERHFRLAHARGAAPVAFEWRDLASGQCTELTVVADDREGLFARLAGTLTANGVDVLSVDLWSREDGVAIDTFRLSEVSSHRHLRPERRGKVEEGVREALAGRLDVPAAVDRWRARQPPRATRAWGRGARTPSVRFDHESSAAATVIEVKAQDRPGLAWTIADALARLGLNITFAKIATAKALALDVFYVTDRGHKLGTGDLPRVEQALLAALAERGATHSVKEAR
jgi:[protein-PII] uridylyltransferase